MHVLMLLLKHVATNSALINLDCDHIESLQNFLGHPAKIHKDYYRQPLVNRDIVNMPRVLEMAQGNRGSNSFSTTLPSNSLSDQVASKYSNISSEDSEIVANVTKTKRLETDSISPCYSFTAVEDSISDEHCNASSDDSDSDFITKPVKKRKRLLDVDLGYVPRKCWNTEEKRTALEVFGYHIEQSTLPSLSECKTAGQNHSSLSERSPQQIRLWIRNQISKKITPTNTKRWTTPERTVMKKEFQDYIKPDAVKYPDRNQILNVMSKYPILSEKSPRRIKSQLQHLRKLEAKRLSF